ncbi:sugar ABC transporter substrate-binding protein [[Phormidium] sp. ETS-05]|uniref:ABC transporter substrate-binding protein n=1 Tax=[Phormidium] sp. ETS-05 TaxID=222819 RepID=UPI001E569138|nr:sugar ABC transporter substrate-binding protein [[Phormidium] sp. ETS-05]
MPIFLLVTDVEQQVIMWKTLQRLLASMLLLSVIVGCGVTPTNNQGTLEVWAHSGQEAERQTMQLQVQRFNAAQEEIQVKLTFIPEGSYNAQVQAAALSGDLPDLLEFDGPFLYNYAWQQNLIPLDELISPEVKNDLLPSIIAQGTYGGKLYSVGTFDSGLGMYGRRSSLVVAGVRIPQGNADAWTASEFQQVLAKLAKQDPDGQVLDLKLNYGGEWFTYGFAPIIYSAGGALIDLSDYPKADGFINGKAAVGAMKELQWWMQKGYVDPNIDEAAFTTGRVALSWAGHWVYSSYAAAVGDDLVVLPLPNFGSGAKTGQGSWNWGISANSKKPQAAMKFLEFLLQPEEVLAMSNANGAVPGSQRAIGQSQLYAEGSPLRLFAEQLLAEQTVPRPRTPAYPVITSAFQQAFNNIRNNLDVQKALNMAAIAIDVDIRDNEGYPNVNQP